MTREKSDQEDTNSNAARASGKAGAKAERRRLAQELRSKRAGQLESTRLAIAKLEDGLRKDHTIVARSEALSSHLTGFYEEIDKLAKGKTLLEVTDLIVEQTNYIIRDAKAIVEQDVYLDRVKEFVPAGNNPVYPDVLLAVRTVQQCLERLDAKLEVREKMSATMLRNARTIRSALECYLDSENDYASLEDVKAILLDDQIVDTWFRGDYTNGHYFDFDRLDRVNVDTDLSMTYESQGEDEEG